jgi:hypothetical protein
MLETHRLALAVCIGIVAFSIALYFLNRGSKLDPVVAGFSLDATIDDIKRQLQQLEDTPGTRLGLKLSEVKVSLSVQEAKGADSSVNLTVPVFDEAAIGRASETTANFGSKVTVILVPPKGGVVLSSAAKTTILFADLLASTREALHDAMESEPKLEAKEIEVELAFVLTAKRSDTVSVKAKVLSAGDSSSREDGRSNTVTLKYINPAYQTEKTGATSVTPP